MTTLQNKNIILVLASWYPNQLDAFNGDFVQRTITAASLFAPQYVIHVVKDGAGLVTRDVTIQRNETDTLTEVVVYYKPLVIGISILDKFFSQRKYMRVYKRAIDAFIKAHGLPALVHVQVAVKAGLLALYLKQKFHIPYIVTEHWTGYFKQCHPNVYSGNSILNRLNKKILQQAALFLPVSDNLGSTVRNEFAAVPYSVVPNVVNTRLFYYFPRKPEVFRFIHPSLMNYQKNPEGILKACKIVKEKGWHFELLMVGKEDAALIQQAKELELYNTTVYFKAAIPYEAVAAEMQESSALLLFSRFENLPCVILEALCTGLPVISSDVGGIKEVVTATNGMLVESENIAALAAAMCRMIDEYHNYDRQQIAAAASQLFNYQVVGKQYADVCKQITGTTA